jgi:hypothetical protein
LLPEQGRKLKQWRCGAATWAKILHRDLASCLDGGFDLASNTGCLAQTLRPGSVLRGLGAFRCNLLIREQDWRIKSMRGASLSSRRGKIPVEDL